MASISGPSAFLFPQTSSTGQSNFSFLPPLGAPRGSFDPRALIQLLEQVLRSINQLGGGWSGFLGGAQPQPLGFNPAGFSGAPGAFSFDNGQSPYGGIAGGNPYGGVTGGGSLGGLAGGNPYGGGVVGNPYGGGVGTGGGFYGGGTGGSLYGGGSTGGVGYGFGNGPTASLGVSLPQYPTDPQEFASYLQAQNLGGTLQGKTGIAQRDAIAGTRFGTEQASEPWQAAVARNYAYQFGAYAIGADPLTPQGLAQGAQALSQMTPDAQLFTQVASIFKGNLLGGPGNYNNPGLQQLLLSRGLTNLAEQPGVGQTDVQTIGAVTAAINEGKLSLSDVINSGTIDNLGRYQNIINYVQSGGFAQAIQQYEAAPI